MRSRFVGLAVMVLVTGAAPLALAAQTEGVVTGSVTDQRTTRALRGILVEAVGTRSATLTDAEGRYVLPALPAGDHVVRFTWYGYRSQEVTVSVRGGGTATLDIAMEPDPLELGEILVTAASRRPERVIESAASVEVVGTERVQDLVATGQAPLLIADMPGVHVMQSGVNSFNVNTRGFNSPSTRQMLLLVDGIDMGNPMVGAQEWPLISVTEDGASLELVRGPGSALYGANAFSGVLSITTPSARQVQGTRIMLSGGELSTFGVDGRHAGVSSDLRWGYQVTGSYQRSGSWDRSRTDLDDLTTEYADAGVAGVTHPLPGFELAPLIGQTKSSPFGVPGGATGDPDPLTTIKGSARVERYLQAGGVITAEGGYARLQNQVNGSSVSRAQVRESTRPWGRVAYSTDALDVRAYYIAREGDQIDLASGGAFEDFSSRSHIEAQTRQTFLDERGSLVFGGSLRREVIDSKGSILAARHDGRSDEYYALFGQLGLDITSALRLTLAGRYDDASLYEPEVSPKVGLQWSAAEDQIFRVTWGRAYLTPTAGDRFIEFPLGPPADLSLLEAGLRASPLGPALLGVPAGELLTNSAAVPILAIGNENLEPGEVTSFEAGYKGQLDRVFLTTDFHLSDFENFQTGMLPGVHPDFAPWTAPAAVPGAVAGAVEDAIRGTVPGITRLADGTTALVFSNSTSGRATQWGVDIGVGVQVDETVQLTGNYSYLSVDFEEGSFVGADSVSANAPTHTANFAASYTTTEGTRVRVGLSLVGGFPFQSGVWVGDVPSRQSVDLNVRHQVTNQLGLALSVTNALNQQRFHLFGGSLVGRRLLLSATWEP